ncbi:MAG: tripartite tricarboxylate transporter TctB family protein [Alkalilacustris sp.]
MQRDWPDILGGLILAAVGIGAALWAGLHYDMGTLRRMGPGAFPVALGLGLAGLGLVIALPAVLRGGAGVRVELGPLLWVVTAILVFGLGLRWLGLVGVTCLAVLIATLPARRAGWVWRVGLALAITAVTVMVFHLGLRMTLPLWPRPW